MKATIIIAISAVVLIFGILYLLRAIFRDEED